MTTTTTTQPDVSDEQESPFTSREERLAIALKRMGEMVDRRGKEMEEAKAERDEAHNAIDRAKKLHRPFKVYDECGHEHQETDEGVTDVEDIGFVCEAGLAYTACSHCCTSYGDQTEECATYHDHTRHICETRAVLAGEDWAKRPAKVGV